MTASGAEAIVFGGLGQVGEALAATAAAAGRDPDRVVQLGRGDADVTDPDAVAAALERHRPPVAINCAVFQPVDRCETEAEAAFAINAVAAGRLAQACRRASVRLVHVSTDYVFSGPLRRPFRESDAPAPPSMYAASKLAGEHLVLAASETHMVVRTSAVYGRSRAGHGSTCFVERMLERARARMPTKVVTDQTVSPTSAVELARAVWGLIDCGGTGVFHAAGSGDATWFEIAKELFRAASAMDCLGPTTAAELGAPAPRAPYTALDNVRLRELALPELAPWREALHEHLRRWHPDLPGLS